MHKPPNKKEPNGSTCSLPEFAIEGFGQGYSHSYIIKQSTKKRKNITDTTFNKLRLTIIYYVFECFLEVCSEVLG